MAIDIKKIRNIREKKQDEISHLTKKPTKEHGRFTQKDVASLIGVSVETYKNLESNKSPVGKKVDHLCKLANVLDVDLIDFIKDDYDFRDKFFHITLKKLKDEDDFNLYLLKLEKEYGRFCVFNTFPSSIYYRDEIPNSVKRFELLSTLNHENKIANREYYPMNEVLSFAFNPYHRLSREERISILNKIINAFMKGNGNKGHDNKHLHIFDPKALNYYHDSPTSTVFFDTKTVLIPSPNKMYELCIIRSDEITQNIRQYLKFDPKEQCGTQDSMVILQLLKDCMEKEKKIKTFVNKLGNENTKLVPFVIKQLSSDFQELKEKWGH